MKLLGTFLALLAATGMSMSEEKAKFDASKLEGKWKIVSGMKAGEKVGEDSIKGEVTITKDTITIKAPDMTHVMSFKIDGSKSPATIDMVGKEGPAKDIKAEGIIMVDGDEVKLAYVPQIPGMEGKRPGKFESTKDNKALYFVMKKDK